MLNFYAFWTLEQGDSTETVITMLMTSAHQCRIDRLVLPIFYYCIIMLSNVASTLLSCDRLLPSLFTVHCLLLWHAVGILNHSRFQYVPGIGNSQFPTSEFLTNFEVKILMCIVHLICVFHYFRIFSGFIVCIFRRVKIRRMAVGAHECRGDSCTQHNLHSLLLRH